MAGIRDMMQARKAMQLMQGMQKLEKHVTKACKYCDMKLDNELHIEEFLKHLEEEHKDKIDQFEIGYVRKFI